MSDKTTHPRPEIPSQKPGEILKEAREKLGLSQKDIASQLNLQVEMLDAVEKNDEERLPASTYVRGYIRGYAKIVKLDGNMLVNLYENVAAAPPEIIPDIKNHTQASSADKPVRAVTYLVTFILALLLIAWLQSNYVIDKKMPATGTTGETGLDEYRENPDPAGREPPQDRHAEIQQPATYPPGSGLLLEIQDDTAEITEGVIHTPGLPETLAIEGDTTATDKMAEESLDTLPIPEDTIYLKLDGDSWIEVYDSGHNILFKNLAKGGEELTLSGIAPFSVLLGYAPGVEVKFNGEPFDPGPYTNKGIARFKLGVQEIPE